MVEVFFVVLTNLLDFLILKKYLKCFGGKEKLKIGRYVLLAVCVLTLSLVNLYGDPAVNLIVSFGMIYLYTVSFSYSKLYHLILPILYFGLGFVSEPIGFMLTRFFVEYMSLNISYGISVLICLLIRYVLVYVICKGWCIQLPTLPLHINLLLFLIPLSSVFISCISIYMTSVYNNAVGNVLCLIIIALTFLTNILTFSIFHKLSSLISHDYKNQLLLQEARAKEQYYKEVESNNKIIREIKHNLKNRLLALSIVAEKDAIFAEELKKILGELETGEKNIYTSNVIINTIINSKIYVATSKKIKVDISILVPKKMNLEYSDAGILLGNLFDNAIEACAMIPEMDRWISLNMIFKDYMLILKICNSKDSKKVDIRNTNKPSPKEHGFGIQSVKKIVEKYNGVVEFMDLGEQFEVSVVLYGILTEFEM